MTNQHRVKGMLAERADHTLSEYELASGPAPSWLIGELLAALHAQGIRHNELVPGRLVVMRDGSAAVADATGVEFSQPLNPLTMAEDFRVPFDTYPSEHFRALLAGYARGGYELIDAGCPEFTDTLLDHLGACGIRPRPAPTRLNVAHLLVGLGASLDATTGPLVLRPAPHLPDRNAWNDSPRSVLMLIAALCALEMDCGLLLHGPVATAARGQGAALLRQLKEGRLAFGGYEHVLRELPGEAGPERVALASAICGLAEPPNAFAYTLRMLRAFPEADATPVGDALLEVGCECALLCARARPEFEDGNLHAERVFHFQRATIALQHFTTGHRSDEGRLCRLMQTLHQCRLNPTSLHGRNWPSEPRHIALAQSLILTHREAFERALARCPEEGLGFPWATAVRGMNYARRALWQLVTSPDDENPDWAERRKLLPSVVKSHTFILNFMYQACKQEALERGSGWATFFFDEEGNLAHLAEELSWMGDFLQLVAQGPPSLEVARQFLALGARFSPAGWYDDDTAGSREQN